MGRRLVQQAIQDETERRVYEASLDSLEQLLRADVVAIVCRGKDGVVSIVPGAGIEREVFEALGSVNWKRLTRIAEEYTL